MRTPSSTTRSFPFTTGATLWAGCVAAWLVGCGPGSSLQPLVGETAAVMPILDTDLAMLYDDAPTLAARAWVESIRQDDLERVWAGLSLDVQTELRAQLPGDRRVQASGPRVLEHVLSGAKGAAAVDKLLGVNPQALRSFPPGVAPVEPPPPTGPDRVEVYALHDSHAATVLPLEFDGSHWRVDALALTSPLPRSSATGPSPN